MIRDRINTERERRAEYTRASFQYKKKHLLPKLIAERRELEERQSLTNEIKAERRKIYLAKTQGVRNALATLKQLQPAKKGKKEQEIKSTSPFSINYQNPFK